MALGLYKMMCRRLPQILAYGTSPRSETLRSGCREIPCPVKSRTKFSPWRLKPFDFPDRDGPRQKPGRRPRTFVIGRKTPQRVSSLS